MNIPSRGRILMKNLLSIAAIAAVMLGGGGAAAFGYELAATIGQATGGTYSAASIPDFSGRWSHPYWPGFEPPLAGPGPVTNRSRLRAGPQAGVGNPNQLVGDYTNPILKRGAAEVVKKAGDNELNGAGTPTPTNPRWPA